MEVLTLTLNQMLMMFTLILAGVVLRKKKLMPENAHTILSRLETCIFLPALNLHNMITKCTVKTFTENSVLIFYGLAIVIIMLLLAYPLSKLFVKDWEKSEKLSYKRNIYKYAITFGNYGFMGNFIVLGIWGTDMFFKYTMFTMLISIICSGWGIYVMVPKDNNVNPIKNIAKGVITPPTVALAVGIVLGFLNFGAVIPEFLVTTLSNASSCMGPVAMLLAGIVIGGYEFKSLFSDFRVYIMTALRLIVIPAILVSVLKFLGANEEIVIFTLIAFATPIGLNTIVYPAAYGGDTKPGASMALISHTLSVVTIPLMYFIFCVLI